MGIEGGGGVGNFSAHFFLALFFLFLAICGLFGDNAEDFFANVKGISIYIGYEIKCRAFFWEPVNLLDDLFLENGL